MKTYFIQIDDCQNNTQAIVKVKASSENAAKTRALKALHICDSIYVVAKNEAIEIAEDNGMCIIDEEGEEIDLEEEDND